MNKQRKRHISRGKFERIKHMAVQVMHVNAFSAYSQQKGYACFVVGDYMYWSELDMSKLRTDGYGSVYYRKSIKEALK